MLIAFCDASQFSFTKDQFRGITRLEGHTIWLVDHLGNVNLIRWKSKRISRVCKSTIAAETTALLEAADTAYFLKLLYEDMLGVKEKIQIDCYSDNESIVQHLKTSNSVSDFRLRIDVSKLREMLTTKDIASVQWIDGKLQIADCLTKLRDDPNLLRAINQNSLVLRF